MIENEKTNKQRKVKKPDSIKDCALSYLKYGDRTLKEMHTYLTKKGYEPEEIKEAIDFLLDCEFVNDERYCERFVEAGIEKRKSSRKLMQELAMKGISKEMASLYVNLHLTRDIKLENALTEAKKYMAKRSIGTEKNEIDKVMRRLAYLGYESDIVYKVAGMLRKGAVDDLDDYSSI